jgi:hypothetical protein
MDRKEVAIIDESKPPSVAEGLYILYKIALTLNHHSAFP